MPPPGPHFIILLIFPLTTFAYSTGAPEQVCKNLQPGHGFEPKDHEEIPYKLTVSSGRDGNITLTISGAEFLTTTEFKGFIIQMRSLNDVDPIGTFHAIDEDEAKVNYLDCNHDQDTVTHSTSDLKSAVSVTWTPGQSSPGQVQVVWSLVRDYQNYWVGMVSPVIQLDQLELGETVTSTSTTTVSPSTSTSKEEIVFPKTVHHVYEGCDVNKTCYGLVNDCEDSHDCDLLTTWSQNEEVTVLELYSNLGSMRHNRYVAMALSHDDKMGDDLVIGCVSVSGKVVAELSWNSGRTNVPMYQQFGNLVLVSGSHVDGQLYCRLKIDNYIEGSPPIAGAETFLYKLNRRQYHVLLAGGHSLPGGHLSYHGAGMSQASEDRVNLAQLTHVHNKVNLLMKCHALIMVAVWLGCAGSGIILARYYKHTWTDADCCGQAQWFIWHRLVMFLVWAGTIAGVVCIFLEVGGWPYSLMFIMTNPHPVLGLAALALTFIQPFLALCRPHESSPLRWIFNWSHWFVGNCAQVIAILAIFFAIELEAAQLERMVTWVVVSYVGLHVLTHTCLTVNTCWSDVSSDRSDVYPLSSRHGSDQIYAKDRRGSGCRKFCFGLYFILTWSIVTLVLLMIWIAPRKLFDGVHHAHSHDVEDEVVDARYYH